MKLWATYIRAVAAAFCWGITFVWYKVAFESGYRPYEVVFLRLLLASVILLVFMVFQKGSFKMERRDLRQMIAVAFFEPFLYFIGEANGMQYVSSSVGSIIIATIPIVAAIGAWIVLRERLSKLVFGGIILSCLGVVVMTLGQGELSGSLKGFLLLFLAIIGAVGYGISVRPLTLKYSTTTIVGYQSIFGMLFFLPLFIFKDGSHFFSMQHSGEGLSTIVAMSLFASIGAFVLYTDVIRKLGVAKANVFTNLIPVFTVFLAAIILKDKIGIKTLLGLGLVLSGLLLSQIEALLGGKEDGDKPPELSEEAVIANN